MTTSPERILHFIVPAGVDDPDRVSGGNVYDRRVRDGLRASGWEVRLVCAQANGVLATDALSELPDGALVLIDGLIAARESQTMAAQSTRLRMIVLAHMVDGASLSSVENIITTSEWTRSQLVSRSLVDQQDVVVAYPGTDPAAATAVSRSGRRLVCVGVLAPHKGQDILVQALARLLDVRGWTCTFVGSLNTAPEFVAELRQTVRAAGMATRVSFVGTLAGSALDAAYGTADLVVVPSRTESFGMVVAEALARGIPVLASQVGGIPEALADSDAGILVPAGDAAALSTVLRQWWASSGLRTELTTAAVDARYGVRSWGSTVSTIDAMLSAIAHSERTVPA